MSVNGYDVEINGVGYTLAEDAEGEHYTLSGEPLRPPNAVTIQGESNQKFQMRPDVLVWSLTDWSGGEGQQKFNPKSANRWRELTGVRVFDRPGTLQPGYYMEDTLDSTGLADFAIDGPLAVGTANGLHIFDANADDVYEWDSVNNRWETLTDLAGPTAGAMAATGDQTYLYWHESAASDLWKWDGVTATALDTTNLTATAYLTNLGGNVYAAMPTLGEVWEIAKAGGSSVQIDDFSDEKGMVVAHGITAMDGKVYALVALDDRSMVREITPTTAAGTGFGGEIARFHGFVADSIWSHGGIVYLAGRDGADRESVLYFAPGAEYGSLGEVRLNDNVAQIVGPNMGAQMLSHFAVAQQLSDTDQRTALYQFDAVTGGMAVLAVDEDGDAADQAIGSLVVYQDQIFISTLDGAATPRVKRAYPGGYTKSSEAISPWHDFDLAGEKILSSLELACEDLPADWTIHVDYAINGEDTWTAAITYPTDGGNGTKVAVSTDTSTIHFHSISIRIRMVYGGAGVPASGPVVLGVDVLAQVAKQVPVWRLLLDLNDDGSRTPKGHSGAQKIANLKTAADSESVVAFKDGYANRDAVTEYDVVIDQYVMVLSHPGEGFAQVTLREIV